MTGVRIFRYTSAWSSSLFGALPRTLARLVHPSQNVPFAWIPSRMGCALVHDHPGIFTEHFLAVDFPEGPRLDLGLLELLYMLPIAGIYAWLGRHPRPPGLYLPLFFVLYAPGRFAFDALRVSDARYLGWTAGQYASLAILALGALMLWRRARCGQRRP